MPKNGHKIDTQATIFFLSGILAFPLNIEVKTVTSKNAIALVLRIDITYVLPSYFSLETLWQ